MVHNMVGVREGGAIQLVTTVLKFVPLVLIGIVGLFFFKSENFTPLAPYGIGSGINAGAALTLWAFIGLESATIPAEEVVDAERTIPRATIIGVLVTTLVYMLTTVAIMGIIPTAQLAQSANPFADAAAIIFGSSRRTADQRPIERAPPLPGASRPADDTRTFWTPRRAATHVPGRRWQHGALVDGGWRASRHAYYDCGAAGLSPTARYRNTRPRACQ
ncbi:MAG: amino acid permease [Chloroflexales bacterium]|nr:amino acid permease [Chloroflexales bacterium]